MAGINGQPDDAQWEAMDAENAQTLGDIAVKTQNKLHPSWKLSFKEVYEAWKMFRSSDSSHLYLVHLKALKDNVSVKYEALIWVDTTTFDFPKDTSKLMRFKELSPCTLPQN